tara:strand:- start:6572 stop:6829 length:258 start_codon:yes stop_codon:yes gene_type:complete
MIVINGIEIPRDTNAIKLEPSPQLDKAVVEYDREKDILVYHVDTLISCFVEQGMSTEEAWEWFDYNTLRTGDYIKNYPNFIYEKK